MKIAAWRTLPYLTIASLALFSPMTAIAPVVAAPKVTPTAGPEPIPSLPAVTATQLLKTVAKQLRLPVKQLKVERSKPEYWDGCLGIFKPGQACTKIGIPGWQAVITRTNGTKEPISLVYHLDKNARRVVQNPTASGGTVPPLFEAFGGPIVPLNDPTVVFRSYSSGTLTGQTVYNSLTTDGKVTRLVTAPNIRSRPVVIRQLTPDQLQTFQKSLQTHRLRNLRDLSYLTSASFADAPTITFDAGVVVQYTAQDLDKMPRALRRIAQDWEALLNG